jgi:hypothetical protein
MFSGSSLAPGGRGRRELAIESWMRFLFTSVDATDASRVPERVGLTGCPRRKPRRGFTIPRYGHSREFAKKNLEPCLTTKIVKATISSCSTSK